jgi:hypothetical protein
MKKNDLNSRKFKVMGFHINDKNQQKANAKNNKTQQQSGSSKFINKPTGKSAGPAKKPVKTGGTRGS